MKLCLNEYDDEDVISVVELQSIIDEREKMDLLEQEKTKEEMRIGEIVKSPKFEEMVYSDGQKEFMSLILNKLKSGEKHNLLFSGFAGTGKTFTAKMIACETQRPFVYMTGSLGQSKIVEMMLNMKDNAIVLIDEIHNLPEKVAEIIYPAIEYGEIYLNGKKINVNCMFIGTTTEPEGLPKPLLERFLRIEFDEPDKELLVEILEKQGINMEQINLILNFTQNIRQIKKLIEYTKLYGGNIIKVFRLMKINAYSGMSDEQEKYISYLKKTGKASLRALSLVLKRGDEYIKREIETELIRKGMIVITSRGRELSQEMKEQNFDNYDELEKMQEKKEKKFDKSDKEVAIKWLKDKEGITESLGKRYLELVNVVAGMLHRGESPDEIDFESFADDIPIEESIDNNYKGVLEEL